MQDQTQEASLYGKEDDVVQVKTMHQSKGLQFPIVYILSQHEQRDKHGSSCILLDSTLGLSLKGLSLDYKLKYNSIYHLALQTKKNSMILQKKCVYSMWRQPPSKRTCHCRYH